MEGQVLRVTLPGKLFLRGDRWWWSVKLPGENKAGSRALRPQGAKAAVSDRETAEKIALETWEQAIREQAQRQMMAESSQKVAALKAQFLDKVRHFTEVVERATAKAEAEARARAEAEAELRRIVQTAGQQKTEDERARVVGAGRVPGCDVSRLESPPCACPNESGQPQEVAPGDPQSATHNPQYEETGYCECCESAGIPAAQLEQIDSGQLLCPHCLAALRADASRIQSHRFARHPV